MFKYLSNCLKLLKQYLKNEENKKIYNDAIQKVIKTV